MEENKNNNKQGGQSNSGQREISINEGTGPRVPQKGD